MNLLTPKEMASLLSYGHTFFEYGQNDKAKTIFNGVLLFDPTNAYAHAMLGAMEQKASNYTQAIEHYSHSIEHDGRNTTTLTNRGECYLNLGRFEDAAKDFKAAMQLDPNGTDSAAVRARFLTSLSLEALKFTKEQFTS